MPDDRLLTFSDLEQCLQPLFARLAAPEAQDSAITAAEFYYALAPLLRRLTALEAQSQADDRDWAALAARVAALEAAADRVSVREPV